jgi:hypothetical protein
MNTYFSFQAVSITIEFMLPKFTEIVSDSLRYCQDSYKFRKEGSSKKEKPGGLTENWVTRE